MINQVLYQIGQMSEKIQHSVKKALDQTTKSQFLSPDTHHQSHPNTTSHPTKQYYKKHEKSSSEPQPMQIPSEPSPSHIRHFMLQQQNSLLKSQIKQLKNKHKIYRQQVRDMKKYIKFLQQYNDGLKKQVVVWMTRPAKKQRQDSSLEQKLQQYRSKFNAILMNNRSIKQGIDSTQYNSVNVGQDIGQYVSQQYQFVNPGGNSGMGQYQQQSTIHNIHNIHKNINKHEQSNQQSQQQQSLYQYQGQQDINSKSVILPTNKQKQQKQHMNNGSINCKHHQQGQNNPQNNPALQCTSCNYLQYQKYRNKFINSQQYAYKKPTKPKSKNKNNSSHNNSRHNNSHNLSMNNNKTLQLRQDNIQIKYKNRHNPHHHNNESMSREQSKHKGNKKYSLCQCHQQYLRNRYS